MKILTSPSSGSIAGTTYSHNRAGQYTRSRRTPVQGIGSPRRAAIKAAFSAASSAWASLTAALQLAWGAFAAQNPYTDSLGQSIKLTGHQMFVAINTQLQNMGLPISSVVPLATAVWGPVLTTLTAVHAGAVTLTMGGGGAVTDHLLIAMSPPQSGGVTFTNNFSQIGTALGNLATAQVLTAAYIGQFGSLTAGQRVFYRLTPVNQYGVGGTPLKGFITVT